MKTQRAIDPIVVCKVLDDLEKVKDELSEGICELVGRVSKQGGRLTDDQWLALKKMWYKYHPGCMPPWTMITGV